MINLQDQSMEDIHLNHASVSEEDPLYLLKSITLYSHMPQTPSFVSTVQVDDAECVDEKVIETEDAQVSQVSNVVEEFKVDEELPFRGVDIKQDFAPL